MERMTKQVGPSAAWSPSPTGDAAVDGIGESSTRRLSHITPVGHDSWKSVMADRQRRAGYVVNSCNSQ